MCLGLDVTKYVSKICKAAVVFGIASASWSISGAFAQDKVRVNPNYKGPSAEESFLLSDDLITEELKRDFDKFLNPQEEPEQYILLTEPNEKERSFTSVNSGDLDTAPSIELGHQYKYDPSLSFSLSPNLIGNGAGQGLTGYGGSRMILSLNPSNTESTPFRSRKTVDLIVGSSFIHQPINSMNSIIQNGFTSQRAYNLSLGVGYSGFNIGASFSRNNTLFSPELAGYDLGFGYSGKSWSANIRVGEYKRDHQLLAGHDFSLFDNVAAYELGAAYRLFSNVNLTGRFTYYSYGLSAEVAPLVDVKSLILGTNLSF